MQRKNLTLIDFPIELLILILFHLTPEKIIEMASVCSLFYKLASDDKLWIKKRLQHFPKQDYGSSKNEFSLFKELYLKKYGLMPKPQRVLFSLAIERDTKNLKKLLTVDSLRDNEALLECILGTKNQKILDIAYKKFKIYRGKDKKIMLNLASGPISTVSRIRYDTSHHIPLLHLAILLNQKPGKVKKLLDKTQHLHKSIFWYGRPLTIAVKFNYFNLVELLLNYKIKFTLQAFNSAISYGSYESAQLLYKYIKINTPIELSQKILNEGLYIAAQNGHEKMLPLLLEWGAEINSTSWFGTTPLFAAVSHNRLDTVKILLNLGANPNIHSTFNCSYEPPLRNAVYVSLEMVILLAENGADMNPTNIRGTNALSAAIYNKKTDIAEYLLGKGAKIELNRYSPDMKYFLLLIATKTANLGAINLLINNGVNVNHLYQDGMMPLHNAVIFNHANVAQVFLENGANINALFKNKTPLDFAKENKNQAITKLLESYHNLSHHNSDNYVENKSQQSNHVKFSLLNNDIQNIKNTPSQQTIMTYKKL